LTGDTMPTQKLTAEIIAAAILGFVPAPLD
jgi:hypothetical protein